MMHDDPNEQEGYHDLKQRDPHVPLPRTHLPEIYLAKGNEQDEKHEPGKDVVENGVEEYSGRL